MAMRAGWLSALAILAAWTWEGEKDYVFALAIGLIVYRKYTMRTGDGKTSAKIFIV